MGLKAAWAEIRNSFNSEWLELVYPPICYHCDTLTESGQLLCAECERAVLAYGAPFCMVCRQYLGELETCPQCGKDWWPLFAYADYQGPLRSVVARFKYNGLLAPAEWGAQRLAASLGDRIKKIKADCFVPVPLYPSRESHRGYNQALELAKALSSRTGISVETELLYRMVNRRPQAELGAASRERNIHGVFEVEPLTDGPRWVLLVDDVVTSGATMREAARVLREAGHEVVAAISIAHGQ